MVDDALHAQRHRIERRLTAIVLLLGFLTTLVAVRLLHDGGGLLLFAIFVGTFLVLLATYVGAAILTPGSTASSQTASETSIVEGE